MCEREKEKGRENKMRKLSENVIAAAVAVEVAATAVTAAAAAPL